MESQKDLQKLSEDSLTECNYSEFVKVAKEKNTCFDDFDDFNNLTEEQQQVVEVIRQKMKEQKEKIKINRANKFKLVEKSLIVLEVIPLNEDVNLKELWEFIVQTKQDGLQWGKSFKLEPVVGLIYKLVMSCTIIDSAMLCDNITDIIQTFKDHVQFVNILSMNKI